MASNIADGVYNATITAGAVYEKNGLKLELRLALCDEGGNAYMETGRDGREYPVEKRMFYTLVTADGAVNTKTVATIRAWAAGWDGVDPFWFCDQANTDAIGMVEATLKTEPSYSDPSKVYQNVRFVNELGHAAKFSGGRRDTPSGDKAAILAKYKAKLAAAAGMAPRPVAAPAKPAAVPAAPTKPAPSSVYGDGIKGQAQLWDEFTADHAEQSQEELTTAWFAALDKVAPGKDQQDLTGAEWKKVADRLGVLPF